MVSTPPFVFERGLDPTDVEISDETFIVTRETALAYREAQTKPTVPEPTTPDTNQSPTPPIQQTPNQTSQTPVDPSTRSSDNVHSISWSGEIPPQKWMNFYTRVLAKFVTGSGLRLTVKVEVARNDGISRQNLEETRAALRELGLNDKLE